MRRSLAALALAVVLPTGALMPAARADVIVKPGETLSEIAERNGVSLERLMQANGIRNANVVVAGTRLVIPGQGRSGASGGGSVTVRQGETLSEIADRNGVSLTRLMQANGISDPAFVEAGRRLVIPGRRSTAATVAAAAPKGYYTVKSGETLSEIADRNNTSVDRLMQLNGISNANMVVAGTRLTVPMRPRATTVAKAGNAKHHVVQSGETLSNIADDYNVSVEKLISLNKISDPNMVVAGTRLQLQAPPPVAKPKPKATVAKAPAPKATAAKATVAKAALQKDAVAKTSTVKTSITQASVAQAPVSKPVSQAVVLQPAAQSPAAQTTTASAATTTAPTTAAGTTATASTTASAAATTPVSTTTTTATPATTTTPAASTTPGATPAATQTVTPQQTTVAVAAKPATTVTVAAATTSAATKPAATAPVASKPATTVALASSTKTVTTKPVAVSRKAEGPDWRTYGPMQVDWANWRAMGGSFVAPSLGSDGKPHYLAINCGARKLNATSQSGQWRTWDSPQNDDEQRLVSDLCSSKGG